MRKLLPIIAFFFSTTLIGQPFGNEWINYTQKYYEFKIHETGVYRIDIQDLINSSIPINTINPKNLQVFSRGVEIPLYISGESDNSFDLGDYVEFYAEANDGWLDTALYRGRSNQPNPFYSLINDTISYYLTWNSDTNNLRYQEENAIDFGNFFVADFLWKENLQVFNSTYYDGEILSSRATNPEYTEAEGWMDTPLRLGNSVNKFISTPNRYAAGPFVDFEIQVAGASNPQDINNGDHHLRITFGNQTIDTIFEGYELLQIQQNFSPTELIKGNNIIRYESIDDRGAPTERSGLAYMRITYPHILNLENNSYFEFQLDDATIQNSQYLELDLFAGGSNPILYDLTNNKRVKVIETLQDYRALVPNGSGRKNCVILAESEVRSIGSISAINGTGNFVNLSANISDSSYVIITHTDLLSKANEYATYRRSTGFNTVLVDVNELYDQFSYGIDKHPLAIRSFMDFAFNDWSNPPSHLFLIGKSVTARSHRGSTANEKLAFQANLVPSLGNPSSDNLLISGLNGSNLEVPIPLGRLSANNSGDIDIYLDKVMEYESAPTAKWMKNALHFAGGQTTFETNTHEGYLRRYGNNFESEFYGGRAVLFRKSSSAPFQTTLADSIRGFINNGVSIMTFFGHSGATGGFDISIDSPDELQNKGRYPLLLANSCFAGNYHQFGVVSTSEDYVIQRDAGVIGFIANGNLGVGFFLDQFSSAFYNNLTNKNYGKSIGESLRQTVRDVQSPNIQDLLRNVCIEMTLQGDPAIVINAPNKNDYLVDNTSVIVQPDEVTADLDSFKVSIRVDNIGLATQDSVLIRMTRKFPDALKEDSTSIIKIAPIFFEEILEFNFSIDELTDVGENEFSFLIDPFNEIDELDEFNNQIDFSVLIRSGEIIPVFPYDFSIVGEQGVTLRASTAFAFEDEKEYVFELDTILSFDSPSKQSNVISSIGGVLEWNSTVLQNMPDSMVYYWRVSKNPLPGELFKWKTSSFQFLPNEEGFSQDHFQQFDDNNYLFLNQNQSNRRFEFTNRASELSVSTQSIVPIDERNDVKYSIDADTRERSSCFGTPAFMIAILDSVTLETWKTPFGGQNPQNSFGQSNEGAWCLPNRNREEEVFNFNSTDSLTLINMRNFLNNPVIQGHYIVIYNWQSINFSTINAIDPTILQAFENLGISGLKTLPDGYPFIISAKAGDPSSVQEVYGSSISDKISQRRVLLTAADFGEMTSQLLGPSSNFDRLIYNFSSLESNSQDQVSVNLIGYDSLNRPSTLFNSTQMNLDTSLSGIVNNALYDQLQLNFRALDNLNQTPPQLDRWQVSYTELGDLALSPNILLEVQSDTLQQGENFEMEVAIKNASQTDFDSVLFTYTVTDSRRMVQIKQDLMLAPIQGDSTAFVSISVPSVGLIGENDLLIEVNPMFDQKEKFSFNNIGQYKFFVNSDRINPLLDVTFDGRHILNQEIVSSEPTIIINLQDDNEFLVLDDTSAFALYLRRPNGVEQLIQFNGTNDIQFIPASLPKNEARVIFQPNLQEDGMYRLRVQAKDKSGNASGNKDYQVEFEIVNQSTVTHLLNYPNPFSTSTQFVFTLTGKEVPDQIQIQIMTITGKVVREIDENELGPIHIGNNITEFAWDGKDEYGDQLANGVYLYKVKMKINGENVERRRTSVDSAFRREFGKMYLLR